MSAGIGRGGTSTDAPAGPSGDELRELLERTLAELDGDERRGPLLGASGMSVRLVVSDLGLTLDVAAADEPGRHLSWSFDGDLGAEPALELEMDSAVAHRFLQGDESLAVAIARGRARCRCGARGAVAFLPVARLIAERYRALAAAHSPTPAPG
ncbi:MAG TPA: hypothetical protein VK919_05925 [Solirubrobacterales bacterium]|nr:hypothetical protein [Solirubrobacterales bacterium]